MRNIHLAGRSVVYGTNGVAATSHPLATEAALQIMRDGGNAVDAAIAASAVLSVVEPMSTGIGGDCFALLSKNGDGEVIGLNGSGRSPKDISLAALKARGVTTIGTESVHSVTIPGAIEAWARLSQDHGALGLEASLRPAIACAEDGFAVSPVVALYWQGLSDKLQASPGAQKFYTVEGRVPEVGARFYSPTIGTTLRAIAKQGAAGFYQGPIAEDMTGYLQSLGGFHTLEDFKKTKSDYVDPIHVTYRGVDVCEIPPNGQGITALIMLNILSCFELAGLDPRGSERMHLEIEAQRLAFELRDAYVADMSFGSVPVDEMTSMETAKRLAARIDGKRAMTDVSDAPMDIKRDTIYLSVIDRDLNTVSFINSLYRGFGSGLVSPETSVTFQNRGLGFSLEPGHPNCLDGGKRPLHTIIPGFLREGSGAYKGKTRGAFGVMGGDYQPVGHTHVVTNMIDFGMDPQEALDSPRAFYDDGTLYVEAGFDEQVVKELTLKGHSVQPSSMPYGGGQIALIDWKNGSLLAGSEPRKDGYAGAI
jgi:gamma-glutamyltranspeptidase/glutathione hydrolase